MVTPKVGYKVKLVPFDAKYAEVICRWYYDVRYKLFFREFEDLPLTVEDFKNFGKRMEAVGNRVFTVLDRQTGEVIGVMTYICLKWKTGVFRFGILLDEAHQGKTWAIECIILLGFFLFDNLGCRKLVVEFLASDKHIQRISEKGGFVREAVLKDEALVDGTYVDEVRYYITRDVAYELYGSYVESLNELEENKK